MSSKTELELKLPRIHFVTKRSACDRDLHSGTFLSHAESPNGLRCVSTTTQLIVACSVHSRLHRKQDASLEWKLQQSPSLTRTFLIGSFNPSNDLMAGNLCDVHERRVSHARSCGDKPSLQIRNGTCAPRLLCSACSLNCTEGVGMTKK